MTIEKLIVFAETGDKNTDELDLNRGFPSRLMPARQWFNWIFNSLTIKTNEIIEFVNKSKTSADAGIGLISICPYAIIPDTHLECDGSIYNKSDFPALFLKLGSLYGGDGINTFAVPDYRGLVARGLDRGAGIDEDIDRKLGSKQLDQMQKITGSYQPYFNTEASAATGAFYKAGFTKGGTGGNAGENEMVNFDSSRSPDARVGRETRMANIAQIYVIKAK